VTSLGRPYEKIHKRWCQYSRQFKINRESKRTGVTLTPWYWSWVTESNLLVGNVYCGRRGGCAMAVRRTRRESSAWRGRYSRCASIVLVWLTLSRIVSGSARGWVTCGQEPAGVAWLVVMWSVQLDNAVPLSFRPQFVSSVILITRASYYLVLRQSSVRMLRPAVCCHMSVMTPSLWGRKLYRLALKVFVQLSAGEKENWCFKWCK
jgi:hypothetical protein